MATNQEEITELKEKIANAERILEECRDDLRTAAKDRAPSELRINTLKEAMLSAERVWEGYRKDKENMKGDIKYCNISITEYRQHIRQKGRASPNI
jgi:chromosome segregation ATPase